MTAVWWPSTSTPISVILIFIASLVSGTAEDDSMGPVFIHEPPNRVEFSNTTGAVIECSARGSPPPEINWVRADGTAVGDVPGLRQVLPNGDLVLPPFRAEDYKQEVHAQVYVCLARNSVGSVHSRDVNVRAVVQQFYESEVNNEYVIRGKSAVLKCSIPSFVADFVSVVAWNDETGNSFTADHRDDKYLLLPTGDLLINDIGPEDVKKSYQCRTKHRLTGETQVSVTKGRLIITAPLSARIEPQLQNVDLGRPAVFTCNFEGNPVKTISWLKDGKSLSHEESVLRIDSVKKDDKGMYQCFVRNDQESAQASAELKLGGQSPPDLSTHQSFEINLKIELPENPYDVQVLDKSERSVKLSWKAPTDENSPIKRYRVEYKTSKRTWEGGMKTHMVYGENIAVLQNLRPATTYNIRVVAESDIGSSKPSDTVTVVTKMAAPSDPPTDIKVKTVGQTSLKISWNSPEGSKQNGSIIGYYVGYKETSSKYPFRFEIVSGKDHYLVIDDLKTYTQYSFVVQAFNKIGASPLSVEVQQYTAEGVPKQPPENTECSTLTSQTIRVSWKSPPSSSVNGILKGYKVIYGPSKTWNDVNTTEIKILSSNYYTILPGLQKYTNYSVTVLAYTSGGDGVHSNPIHCQTEQDVPEPPAKVKVVAKSESSALVSWKPPQQTNGIIVKYTVYYREVPLAESIVAKSQKVPSSQMSYEVAGLKANSLYEFCVTASTDIGESRHLCVIFTRNNPAKVPAQIATFNDSITVTYKEEVKLPCLVVGIPPPKVQWQVKGAPFQQNDRMRQLPEGSLLIKEATRTDAGEYACYVENSFGHDTVTHQLTVHAPPRPPLVLLNTTTNNSITIQVHPHPSDRDTSSVKGYTIYYKMQFGNWETVQIDKNIAQYTLEELVCGTKYDIYVTAYNDIGTSESSLVLKTSTEGTIPVVPEDTKKLVKDISVYSITLDMGNWKTDGNCPILYFVIEIKKAEQLNWVLITNNLRSHSSFLLLDLDSATLYQIRVTAINTVGPAQAELQVTTMKNTRV